MARLDLRIKNRARELLSQGMSWQRVSKTVGCQYSMVYSLWRAHGLRRPRRHNELRLSLGEREEISRRLPLGDSYAAIARRLGRNRSTVSREVNANGGRARYRAWAGDERAEVQG